MAVAMADGSASGLALLDNEGLGARLSDYHLYHATRADLLRRAGDAEAATASYQRALTLCQNQVERRYLLRRLREVDR